MFALLPTENWKYNIIDIFYGIKGNFSIKKNTNINLYEIGNCIPIRSARIGIILSLKALNLPKNARIGVPLYCCPVVFKAIKTAGFIPFFIDVDYETYCMSAEDLYKKRNEIDAVITVHMFGNVCDMPTILKLIPGKPIIEDCAQSLGSRINGNLTGSFGTISVFSFRSGKTLSIGEGGALFTKDLKLKDKLLNLNNELPTPNQIEEYLHIMKTYIRSKLRGKYLWGFAGYKIWEIYNKKVDYLSKSPINISQIYKSDLSLINRRLSMLNNIIEKQRANANYYLSNLKLNSKMLCQEKSNTYYNRYFFPILFNSLKQREWMSQFLYKQKIDSSRPYRDIVEIATKYYNYQGGCPIAEEISKRVLIIPSNFNVKKHELIKITHWVNQGWFEMIGENYD